MRTKKIGGFGAKRRKDLIFYGCMIFLPVLQYAIFYIGVNFNSIKLSFQQFEALENNSYKYSFDFSSLFANYKDVFKKLFTEPTMKTTLKNSLIAYSTILLIDTPLALLFSYYIMKKFAGNKAFRIILFMPSIISGMVMIYMFQVLVDNLYPEMMGNILNLSRKETIKYKLLTNPNTRLGAIIVYRLFLGFGLNVLLYTGAMSGVSEEMMEAARIDGVTDWGEFVHIVLPSVWKTLTTFLVVGVAGFFTNNLGIFDLYGEHADSSIWTLGYYMYRFTVIAGEGGDTQFKMYPFLSAMGIVFTLFAFPMSMLVKRACEKFGPSEE